MCLRDKQDAEATLDAELTLGVNTGGTGADRRAPWKPCWNPYVLTFCSVIFLPSLPSPYRESFLFSMKRRSKESKDRPTSCWQGPADRGISQPVSFFPLFLSHLRSVAQAPIASPTPLLLPCPSQVAATPSQRLSFPRSPLQSGQFILRHTCHMRSPILLAPPLPPNLSSPNNHIATSLYSPAFSQLHP